MKVGTTVVLQQTAMQYGSYFLMSTAFVQNTYGSCFLICHIRNPDCIPINSRVTSVDIRATNSDISPKSP